jgi:hypothetical protein
MMNEWENWNMRILLDAKDLINIVEHDFPVSVVDFGQWLRDRDSVAVLSFTGISDFVGPAFPNNTFLEKRVLLQKIETLPVVYIREGTIVQDELRAAMVAFHNATEPIRLTPYVRRWDETAKWEGDAATKILVGLRLDEIVYMARRAIQIYKVEASGIRSYIESERVIPKAERWTLKEMFINRLPDRFGAYKIDPQIFDVKKFGEWLWSEPKRCLGMRLHFESHHQMVNDKSLRFDDGDIADFAHIAALPYVDILTVDKRIDDLLKKVLQKFKATAWAPVLQQNVFRNIGQVMEKFQ